MNDPEMTSRGSECPLLDQLIAQYVGAVEAGEPPSRDDLMKQHPELAGELQQFFRHRDRVEALLEPLRSAARRVLNVRCPHCHGSIELLDHAQATDLNCPACGSSFSLAAGQDGPSALHRIGQFQLVEQVGMGQFGTVWKAQDLALERIVALKLPRSRSLSAEEAEVFLRDARVAAQLRHPNIVGVHEVGKHEDTIYIVSDFIQGASLKKWAAVQPPTIREAVELCATVAETLHFAHEAGVVHRDLKPGNVMIDLENEPRIVDFGLAKRESGEITMTLEGQVLGTPAYMPPEQARGDSHHVTRHADVYSLGVILFELLTGELPFRGDKTTLLMLIQGEEPPSPRKLNARIPRDLETVCLKCLEKDPQNRYPTAQHLADDLRRFLTGAPVVARPVSVAGRAWRWCRRSPVFAGLLGTVVSLLCTIAIVAVAAYLVTQDALQLAQDRAEAIERNLYYSEMNRAGSSAGDSDGLEQVRRLTTHWEPRQTRRDRRGWEWYYLNSLLHQDLVTLRGHAGGAFSVAWSPDGSLLASGSGDGTIRLWASSGRCVRVWKGHARQVNSLAWDRRGKRLASAGYDGLVNIWKLEPMRLEKSLAHPGAVEVVRWDPECHRLAVAHQATRESELGPSEVTIWDTREGESNVSFGPADAYISDIRWHSEGSSIAVAATDNAARSEIRLWDARSGTPLSTIAEEGQHLAWSPEGTWLAVRDFSDLVILDGASRNPVAEFAAFQISPAWSKDGRRIAYASGQKSVRISDVQTAHERAELRGHMGRIEAVCWHPEGKRIATASMDGTVKIWNPGSPTPRSPGARAISWSPDGSRYASRDYLDLLICRPGDSRPFTRWSTGTELISVAWSPDGRYIASANTEGEISLRDSGRGSILWAQNTLVPDQQFGAPLPTMLAWSPDSGRLAFPSTDNTIRIVQVRTGATQRVLEAPTQAVRTLAWSPDGRWIASGGYDPVLRIWDPSTGRVAGTRDIANVISSVCWSPDSTRICAAAGDNSCYVWSVSEQAPRHVLSGHTTYVHSVAWNPDGERIASGDQSGSVRIWDAETGLQTLKLTCPEAVPMVAWSPDGKQLAAVAFGGSATTKIWDANSPQGPEQFW